MKFRDKDERNVASAFWELFLHELHRRLGFEITVHPSVPGTTRRPDFRFANAEHAFYLEAAVVAHSDKEMASRQLEAIVLDIINQAHSPDFSLSVDWKRVGRTMHRRQEVVGKVEAWLATLDWKAEREKLATRSWNDPRRLPAATTVIEFGDWAASLTAFPRRTRGGKFKASRYGRPDLPYVIAVGLLLDFAQFEDLEQALYGPETLRVIWPFGDKQPEMLPSREPHGLWQHGNSNAERGCLLSYRCGPPPHTASRRSSRPCGSIHGRAGPSATSTPSRLSPLT